MATPTSKEELLKRMERLTPRETAAVLRALRIEYEVQWLKGLGPNGIDRIEAEALRKLGREY